MSPAPLLLACAALAATVLVLDLLLWRRRARERAQADELRRSVEPYLRRKAAEAGLPVVPAPTPDRRPPAVVLTDACDLAGRLLAHERGETPPASTYELVMADTEQLSATALGKPPGRTTAPERPATKKTS